jgi:hypothetical protein
LGRLSRRNKKFSNNKILHFDSQVTDITQLNPNLSLAKCKIAYVGQNRNGSYITQECMDDMATQIAYSAVVGEWKENNDNFGDHGGKIEITNDGMQYIDTTSAYGCVTNEPTWYEDVIELDGNTHTYLCCNLILFTGKFPELQKIIENGSWQSMEINCLDIQQKDGLLYIQKAEFMALCILGKDIANPDNNVEPCFENSTIEVVKGQFAFMKNEFKKEFSQMLFEIKESLTNDTKEVIVEQTKKEDKSMKKKDIATKYNLTCETLESEISRVLALQTYSCTDWDGSLYNCTQYYLIDYDMSLAYVYDSEQDIYVQIPYAQVGDDIVMDYTATARIKFAPVLWSGITPTDEDSVATSDDDDTDMSCFAKGMISDLKTKYMSIVEAKVLEAVTTKETELNAAFAITLEATKVEFAEKEEAFNKSAENIESVEAPVEIPVEAPIEVVPVEATFVESDNVELDTKNDAIIALNERFTALESTLKDKESVIAEKDALIEALKSDNEKFNSKERQEKVEAIFSKFSKVLSKEEIDDFRKKESTFAKIEEFAKELKAFCADKLVETFKNETAKVSRMGLIGNEANEDVESKNESTLWERLDNKLKTNK